MKKMVQDDDFAMIRVDMKASNKIAVEMVNTTCQLRSRCRSWRKSIALVPIPQIRFQNQTANIMSDLVDYAKRSEVTVDTMVRETAAFLSSRIWNRIISSSVEGRGSTELGK